jgi:hypothetical protein
MRTAARPPPPHLRRYHAQLGQPDTSLADRAAARLAAAGNRAVDRQDYRAGAALLARAAELVRPHRTDVALELEFAWAHGDLDLRAAIETAEAVTERRGRRVTSRGRCSRLRWPSICATSQANPTRPTS